MSPAPPPTAPPTAPPTIARRAERASAHLPLALLRAMRPSHWVKNVVVFAAPLFALEFTLAALLEVLAAFAAFSLTASAFYLLNDVADVEADRQHPRKRSRPIAAGLVPVPVAVGAAVVALVGSLAAGFVVAPLLGLCVSVYAALQLAYNLVLKHKTIVDIMTIAAGFVLRALGGAAATGVAVSAWFVLCIGLLAFFLGIEKRKAELRALGAGASTRVVLHTYTLPWLTRMAEIVTATALMAYAMWTIEEAASPWMLATLPLVIYAIFKYQYLAEMGEGETPEKTLVRSPHILAAVVLWGCASALILLFLG